REMLLETWDFVKDFRRQGGPKHDVGVPAADPTCIEVAKHFGLAGVEQVGRRKMPDFSLKFRARPVVNDTFIELVNSTLPAQPWKPGVHIQVAKQLKAKVSKVSAAIQILVERGTRLKQKDGVVFGKDGSIVAIDQERVQQ